MLFVTVLIIILASVVNCGTDSDFDNILKQLFPGGLPQIVEDPSLEIPNNIAYQPFSNEQQDFPCYNNVENGDIGYFGGPKTKNLGAYGGHPYKFHHHHHYHHHRYENNRRPKPPNPPTMVPSSAPTSSTTEMPSIDPRLSTLSLVATSTFPSIDIRIGQNVNDKIVFPE